MGLTRSEIMSRIRSRDTAPELRLRRALVAASLRGYRLHQGPHKPDVSWPGRRVAVFVDGCFWHGCPRHGKVPKTRTGYWRAKIDGNRARDRAATLALRRAGWKVVRYWEHSPPPVERIRKALAG